MSLIHLRNSSSCSTKNSTMTHWYFHAERSAIKSQRDKAQAWTNPAKMTGNRADPGLFGGLQDLHVCRVQCVGFSPQTLEAYRMALDESQMLQRDEWPLQNWTPIGKTMLCLHTRDCGDKRFTTQFSAEPVRHTALCARGDPGVPSHRLKGFHVDDDVSFF